MILDQFGNKIKALKKPDTRPLGAARMVMSDRDYVSAGLTPLSLASIFRDADAGDVARQAELFEQIEEKDGHLRGEISKRVNVITDVDFQLGPATDSDRDLKVVEFIEEHLFGLDDWPDVMTGLNESVGKGFSAFEPLWDVNSGQAVIYDFKAVPQKRFIWTDPDGYLAKYPRLISDEDLMGAPIPDWKIVLHRYGGKTGNATRAALYRICAWMFLFKNYSVKDWLTFAEVYGMPLRVGKYDPGASDDDKGALKTAVQSLGADAAGIISKSTEIEFVESIKGKETGELYQSIVKFANDEMSKALLGQSMTAGLDKVGAYGAVSVFNGVRMDLVRADSRALPVTIRAQIIRPLVGFNFGWDTPLPRYAAVWDEDENLKEKAEWVEKLLDKGVKMGAKWLRSEFKIPDPEDGEETVGGVGAPACATHPVGANNYSPVPGGAGADNNSPVPAKKIIAKDVPAGDDPDAADRFAARGAQEARPVINDMVDVLRDLVMTAGSLEEIKDKIFDQFGAVDPEVMATLIAKAIAAGNLAGRYEIQQEAGE